MYESLQFGTPRPPLLSAQLPLQSPVPYSPSYNGGFDVQGLSQIGLAPLQNTGVGIAAPAPTQSAWDRFTSADFWLGKSNPDGSRTMGAGQLALGLGSTLFNAYMGMKQYGLARDQFNQGKKEFAANYENQRTLTNARLEDRQRARLASNPNAYESLSSYMQKNSIKPFTP